MNDNPYDINTQRLYIYYNVPEMSKLRIFKSKSLFTIYSLELHVFISYQIKCVTIMQAQ